MMINNRLKIACALLASSPAFAHDWNSARPDSHAPISVMGEHTHKAGEFMLSYRHMKMDMDTLQDGTSTVSAQGLLDSGSYMMAPTKMSTQMHMLGMMYAPTNNTTTMVMLPYIEKDMDMLMKMNAMTMQQSMESNGVGDLKLGALHNIYDQGGQKIHLNLMMSVPTGSIDEENSSGAVLPYNMQLGSGTVDLLPGITINMQKDSYSMGAQAQATIRLGDNERDYSLGNRFKVQGWLQKPVHNSVSLSVRLAFDKWQDVDGKDSELNPMMNPLADANLQAGSRVSAGLGMNLTLPSGNRLAVEYNKELQQDLDGPQMAMDNSLVLAWQFSFK